MNLAALLIAPALVAQAPQAPPKLPTPTPGLSELGQRINYGLLTEGIILKEFDVDGKHFTLRNFKNIVGLYNDVGHMILCTRSLDPDPMMGAGAVAEDPFPQEGQEVKIVMDDQVFVIKLIRDKVGVILAVYNSRKHILFAIGNPDLEAIFVPEPVTRV
jgi:hypothetical protein